MRRLPQPLVPKPHEHDYHVMVKPIGGICNLNCAYCYYLPTVEMYRRRPDHAGQFRMSLDTLELFTRQYLDRPLDVVHFAWQGGEPTLMGLDWFRQAMGLQAKYRRPAQTVENSLQTNGTLLDDEWCAFLRENGFLIGLSVDGPAHLHDRYRRAAGDGQPSWDRVNRGLRLLLKHRVEFNSLVVLSQANVREPETVYRYLTNQGLRHIQFIPLLEYDRQTFEPIPQAITGREYGEFLCRVFDLWFEHHIGTVFVQIIEQTLASHVGVSPSLCVHMPTCGRALILEHNGDVYACDHYAFESHLRGNIHERGLHEMVNSAEQLEFGHSKQTDLPAQCRTCGFLPACNGGCCKHRIVDVGEPGRLNWFCEGYRMFYDHSFDRLAAIGECLKRGWHPRRAKDLLAGATRQPSQAANGMQQPSQGPQPAEPQAPIAMAEAPSPHGPDRAAPAAAGPARAAPSVSRAARNDPCPCGSGLKFKRCCGRKL